MTLGVGEGALLSMRGVEARYRGLVALEVGELEVPPGRVLVVGPNGSGKTTLIRVALGLHRPARGTVRTLGLDPLRQARQLHRRVTYVRDRDDAPGALKVDTLIEVLAEAYGPQARRLASELGLTEHSGKRLSQLSRGMRRRASLLAALASNRDLVVVDEPFAGLDAESRRLISRLLDEKDNNMIIISHIPPRIAFNTLIIVEAAKITYAGPYKDPATLGYQPC